MLSGFSPARYSAAHNSSIARYMSDCWTFGTEAKVITHQSRDTGSVCLNLLCLPESGHKKPLMLARAYDCHSMWLQVVQSRLRDWSKKKKWNVGFAMVILSGYTQHFHFHNYWFFWAKAINGSLCISISILTRYKRVGMQCIIIIIIIIIIRGRQERYLHLISSNTPAPQYQHIKNKIITIIFIETRLHNTIGKIKKEEKRKTVEDEKEASRLDKKKHWSCSQNPPVPHHRIQGQHIVPQRHWERNRSSAVLRCSAARRRISIPMCD